MALDGLSASACRVHRLYRVTIGRSWSGGSSLVHGTFANSTISISRVVALLETRFLMTATIIKRKLAKRTKENRVWLDRIRDYGFIEQDLAKIPSYLSDASVSALRQATVPLDRVAIYEAVRGELAVMDGDLSGWEAIHRSVAYQLWSFKILSTDIARSTLQGKGGLAPGAYCSQRRLFGMLQPCERLFRLATFCARNVAYDRSTA